MTIGNEEIFREVNESLSLKVVDIAAGSVERWIDELEEWCEQNGRLPSLSSENKNCYENRLAIKMTLMTYRGSKYKKEYTARAKSIVAKYENVPPSNLDLYTLQQMSTDIGKPVPTIRAAMGRLGFSPAFIGGRLKVKEIHYYDRNAFEQIKKYYKSHEKRIGLLPFKEVLAGFGITYIQFAALRRMYDIPKPKKYGKSGWHMSKAQVKWIKQFLKVGDSLGVRKRAIARRAFIEDNPQPAFPVG